MTEPAGTASLPGFLAHGMGKALVEPDWPPLTDDEVSAVLARYGQPGGAAVVSWRSPRPMSAAALVRYGGGNGRVGAGAERGRAQSGGGREARGRGGQSAGAGRTERGGGEDRARGRGGQSAGAGMTERGGGNNTVFVKRHHTLVRTAGQLAAEHALAAHLRALGVAVPEVLRTMKGDGEAGGGATTVTSGDYVYEVHAPAEGIDLYRDVPSWSPFTSSRHARAAGAVLARFHRASASFGLPERPPGVLTSSCALVTAPDPLAAVARLAARRPGLASYLDRRRWRDDLTRYHLPAIRQAAPLLGGLERLWGHGDLHPSNLTWVSPSPDAGVAAVIDLGLANRTFAAHDLAVAIERSAVAWLDLADTGRADVDIPAVDALLDGYQAVRPLARAELLAVARLLPVVHVEYALSEVEYFASVVGSSANADLAYDAYLIGHTRWFGGPDGSALLSHLRQRAARPPAGP